MITTEWPLYANGVALNTLAWNVRSYTGRLRAPGRRGADTVVPGRHGAIRTPGKRYDTAEVVLTMWVLGADEDGLIPEDPGSVGLLRDNVDRLNRLFAAPTLELEQHRPGVTPRRIEGEVRAVIDYTTMAGGTRAEFAVTISSWMAFWEDTEDVLAETTTEGTWEVDDFAAATAPCDDLSTTFLGPCSNPRIEHGGVWAQYNQVIPGGQGITLDSGTWELGGIGGLIPDYSLVDHGGDARWFVLQPGDPPEVTITDTSANPVHVQLVGRRKYLTP